jgi:hypothetical protein
MVVASVSVLNVATLIQRMVAGDCVTGTVRRGVGWVWRRDGEWENPLFPAGERARERG